VKSKHLRRVYSPWQMSEKSALLLPDTACFDNLDGHYVCRHNPCYCSGENCALGFAAGRKSEDVKVNNERGGASWVYHVTVEFSR
jgi:hypothetical protein